jgi:maltokinase
MSNDAFDDTARWFGGKGRPVARVEDAGSAGGLSLRDVRYADGGCERYLDVPSGFAWSPLLSALRAGPISGSGGTLELRRGAALDAVAIGSDRERIPATDQSNTLVVIDERLLVKAYRRLEPGPNAEVEVLAALDGRDAPVPPYAGSIHWLADAGTDTAIALLQGFVPGAEDGWEGPIARVAAALVDGPPYDMTEWRAAGTVTAELHAALVDAFGLHAGGAEDLAGWRAEAEAALEVAGRDDAELSAVAAEIRGRLGALERIAAPPVTRIHGDLHVAQLLRTAGAPLVIDFEGDPIRPLAARRRLSTPLWDVATLLRCLDHLGSAAARRDVEVAPDAWIDAARTAALDAYCARSPVAVDRRLVAVLELAKECMEFVYAVRYVPEWLYAPRAGLRRLLEAA